MSADPQSLQPRHGDHHYANVKYGYIIFGVSVVYALVLAVSHYKAFSASRIAGGNLASKSVWFKLLKSTPTWAHVLVWVGIMTGLSFFHIEELSENVNVLLKRVGRLAFCLLPLNILLAMRPSFLATSYLEYMQLHKWLLRVIIIATFIHGLGFLVSWLLAHTFMEKTFKLYNFLGVVVALLALVLLVVSVKPLRERTYKLFYLWHNITIGLFLVLTIWHARPGVLDFIALSALMIIIQLCQRILKSHALSAPTISDRPQSTLALIKFPKPDKYPASWSPGSHIRLHVPLTNVRAWLFASHPFTLANYTAEDLLCLIVSKRNRFMVLESQKYTITTPFESIPLQQFALAEHVVVLCGGSCISLGLPVHEYMAKSPDVSSQLVWATPSRDDAFIIESFPDVTAQVYVTQDSPFEDPEDGQDEALLSRERDIELGTLNSGTDAKTDNPSSRIDFHRGRPNLDDVFHELLEGGELHKKWIVVCGPTTMVGAATAWGKSHGISVYSECYAF